MLGLFLTHFWQYFFVPKSGAWYTGQVWSNVVAVLPLAVLAALGWFWHRGVMAETHAKLNRLALAHDTHAIALQRVLNALDPDTDGGLRVIADQLDLSTPGGLAVLDAKLERLVPQPPTAVLNTSTTRREGP